MPENEKKEKKNPKDWLTTQGIILPRPLLLRIPKWKRARLATREQARKKRKTKAAAAAAAQDVQKRLKNSFLLLLPSFIWLFDELQGAHTQLASQRVSQPAGLSRICGSGRLMSYATRRTLSKFRCPKICRSMFSYSIKFVDFKALRLWKGWSGIHSTSAAWRRKEDNNSYEYLG